MEKYIHYIKMGKTILDEEYLPEWERCVVCRINDIYHGDDLKKALEIIKILNHKKSFNLAQSKLNEQDNSNNSRRIILSIIRDFCHRGNSFYNYINMERR